MSTAAVMPYNTSQALSRAGRPSPETAYSVGPLARMTASSHVGQYMQDLQDGTDALKSAFENSAVKSDLDLQSAASEHLKDRLAFFRGETTEVPKPLAGAKFADLSEQLTRLDKKTHQAIQDTTSQQAKSEIMSAYTDANLKFADYVDDAILDTKFSQAANPARDSGVLNSAYKYGASAFSAVTGLLGGKKVDEATEVDNQSVIPQTGVGSVMPDSEYGPYQPEDRYTLTRYPKHPMGDESTQTFTLHTASDSEEHHPAQQKPRAAQRGPQFRSRPVQATAASQAPPYASTAQSQHMVVHAPAHSMVRSQPVAYSGIVPQVSTFASAAPSLNINVNSDAASAYMKYQRRQQLEQSFQKARMALARSELVDDVEQSIGRLQDFDAGFGTSLGGGSVFGAFPAVPMRSGLGTHFSAMSVSNSFIPPTALSVGYF